MRSSATSIHQTAITIPIPVFVQKIQSFKFDTFLSSVSDQIRRVKDLITSSRHLSSFSHHRRNPFKNKHWLRPAILLLALILLIVGGKLVLSATRNASQNAGKYQVKPPRKTITVNKEFSFPIRSEDGSETGKVIKYLIEKAEVADEIIVKGQRATAVKGRVFLVFTIKLVNDEQVGVEIDTRDYVRLVVGDSEERLAADIHNDPVEVQPLSTKYTRVGFPLDDKSSDVKLFVGEIKGDKQTIAFKI